MRAFLAATLICFASTLVACGSSTAAAEDGGPLPDAGAPHDAGSSDAGTIDAGPLDAGSNDAGSNDAGSVDAGEPDAGSTDAGLGGSLDGGLTSIAGCSIFPANHIFNTPIDGEPKSTSTTAFLSTIGTHNLHLDLGTETDQSQGDYYGIPYNVVHGAGMSWTNASYYSADSDLDWDPSLESDCAVGSGHTFVSPCISSSAPQPQFPIPASPLVEGGIDTDSSQEPYGDHHILILDADSCRLWELYHSYPGSSGSWDIFGSASFDLRSNNLRPDGWTSADAAGFPILPLLLRAEEANTGAINHALRFTIQSDKIRTSYVWPARHLTSNGTSSTNLPPMGQLFRLPASYTIPASFHTQSKAILQALKTYGMYIADGGSDMYLTGEPSALWEGSTFDEVQSVSSAMFEAVDLTEIRQRPGFDPNSAAVP